jgi:glucose/arabinose dehydrogenase
MSIPKEKLSILLIIIALFWQCTSNQEDDLQDLVEDIDGDYISSETLNFQIDTIATGLNNPWGLTFLPNKDLLVTERDGEIRIIRDEKLLDQKISGVPKVYARGQGGLFEIELHPNYEDNGWLYLSYAAQGNGGGNTAIMRAKLSNFNLIEREVIFLAEPFLSGGTHFGGRMAFDRDGYLYFSIGDRGRQDNSQTLKNHCGKIFRLNDNGSIPGDNPFINESGAMPEIYTFGNRNPQGMAIHPETGEIWTHEHGPKGGDEINIIKSGTNYGWPEATYGKNYDGSIITEFTTKEGMADPLHYWEPSIAPSGMSFVTSDKYGVWKGNLLVGSLKFRYVARLELGNNEVIHEEKLLENIGRVRAIAESPDGYIYISTESPGMVLRIVPE